MSLRKIVAFCLTFVYLGEVALALANSIGEGRGDRSQELKPSMSPWNGTESAENLGPPDSHEAMNDQDIFPIPKNVREKRSFEFLMGLINNNSRFEVTRVDPENTTKKPPLDDLYSLEEDMSGKILVIFLCLAYVCANTVPITSCPDYPGLGVLKVGESKAAQGECTFSTCRADGSIISKTCAEFIVQPPCKYIPGNKTALYPDCCKTSWCPE